jgi:hypothetical protein
MLKKEEIKKILNKHLETLIKDNQNKYFELEN